MMEWKKYRIKDVAKYIGSGSTPKSTSMQYYQDGTFSWINTGDLNNDVVNQCAQCITQDALDDYPNLKFYPINTLLVAMYGATIGKAGLLGISSTINQACCGIIPNKKVIVPKFGLYYMLYYKDRLVGESCGSTQLNVSQDKVQRTHIMAPSLPDQQRIASYLDDKTSQIDTRISFLEQKCDAYEQLKKSIINDAVTKGFNPNVEMKESGVDWIGLTPAHWEYKRFKELASTTKGKQTDYLDEQVPDSDVVLTVETLRQDIPSFFNYAVMPDKRQYCTEDDLIVIWDGAGVGEFLRAKEGVLSSTIAKVTVDESKVLKEYLWLWRYKIEYTLKSIPTGMGIPHLNPNLLNSFIIPIPPLSEQQEIIDAVTEKSEKLDEAISNLESQVEQYKLLKRSLINEVITGQRAVKI